MKRRKFISVSALTLPMIGIFPACLTSIEREQMKQKIEKFFRGGFAPIISLTNVDGKCLVTDYDGRFTLLKVIN